MEYKTVMMGEKKTIALVAHDNKKQDLLAWAKFNRELLAHHQLVATGTTGLLLETELDLPVSRLQSGPLGGDQQIVPVLRKLTREFVSDTAGCARHHCKRSCFFVHKIPPVFGLLFLG